MVEPFSTSTKYLPSTGQYFDVRKGGFLKRNEVNKRRRDFRDKMLRKLLKFKQPKISLKTLTKQMKLIEEKRKRIQTIASTRKKGSPMSQEELDIMQEIENVISP